MSDAGALRDRLAALLSSATVRLDASAVQRVDTAGLQVLAAFARDRRTGGRPLEWVGDSPALTQAARLLGLAPLLGLPECDPADARP